MAQPLPSLKLHAGSTPSPPPARNTRAMSHLQSSDGHASIPESSLKPAGLEPSATLKSFTFPKSDAALDPSSIRRRVRSINASPSGSRRQPSEILTGSSMEAVLMGQMAKSEIRSIPDSDIHARSFSDEYDLSREDPRILQDVERALKLKARREARVRSGQSPSPRRNVLPASDVASGSSISTNSTPSRHNKTFSDVAPLHLPFRTGNLQSEVDFSPSTALTSSPIPTHPVPSSLNAGATLDWTGLSSDDEKLDRRWSLSLPKRKARDKAPVLRATLQRQQAMYTEKLSAIRARASPQTIRKVAITREQLKRRYVIVYESLSSGSSPINLASVARWHASQESVIKATLEDAEPRAWLKHLERRNKNTWDRSPWHLSALVVEEYVRFTSENSAALGRSEHLSPRPSSLESSLPSTRPTKSFYVPLSSNTSSHFSLGPSFTRKRSFEENVSFEPLVYSRRNSVDSNSRKKGEASLKPFQPSSPNRSHSSLGSLHGDGMGEPKASIAISPPGSPRNFKDAKPVGRRALNDSEDGSSSAHNSMSDPFDDGPWRRKKSGSKSLSLQLERSRYPGSPPRSGSRVVMLRDPLNTELSASTVQTLQTAKTQPMSAMSEGEQPSASVQNRGADARSAPHRVLGRRRMKTSLLTSARPSVSGKTKRQQEIEDQKAQHEYELKSQLLGDVLAQNSRTRHVLNRIAVGVRQYESAQSDLVKSRGVPNTNLPSELIEAFTHDPAAITGATRRLQGWRAVEDINNRVIRQRAAFRNFIASASTTKSSTLPHSVLQDPTAALVKTLHTLESCKQEVETKARGVGEVLDEVKVVHASVKSEYNDTLSHTSVIYPELSHIVALEESYKDQYQYIWEIGMDALTFLLDTVTPFWRTYGKTIGEDVQDFLVIPVYRNEFTGEAKRYPIESFPRRSLRHWMALLLFFVLNIAVNILQARAAIMSSLHCRLHWIAHSGIRWSLMPFFAVGIIIQWCAVIIELSIVVAQFGVLAWWLGWAISVLD